MPESRQPLVTSPSPEEARAALDRVRIAQQGVSDGLVIPTGYDAIYAIAIGTLVLGVALINAQGSSTAVMVLGGVLALAGAGSMAALMQWFRRVNGYWLSGITPRRARWVAWASGVQCGVFVFLGSLAGNAGEWGWTAAAVVATIVLSYTLGRLWLTVFRAETRAGR